jgi:hypothetical protein
MKFTRNTLSGLGKQSWVLAATGALALGIACLGFVGGTGLADNSSGGEGLSDDGNTRGPDVGGFSLDDEFVGTLPTRREDDEGNSPGFFLQGPRQTILDAFVSMNGPGTFSVEPLPTEEGEVEELRLTFQGELMITLDKCVLTSTQTKLGVSASTEFGATLASAMTDAALLMVEPIPEHGNLEIPFSEYEAGGLLEAGVDVVTFNRLRGRDSLGIITYGGVIEMTQGSLPQ